jgi:hypothetical protein
LASFVLSAENAILRTLADASLLGRELQSRVLSIINIKENRDGEIEHQTKPIHMLAFIIAYKQLEQTNQITILRSSGVPFPMTDFETTFAIQHT